MGGPHRLPGCRGLAVHGRVAVNLSAVQFRNPSLVQTIQAALAVSGLAAARLELEITESVLLHDSPAPWRCSMACARWASEFAMDDSAPATARLATCTASRSTRSR